MKRLLILCVLLASFGVQAQDNGLNWLTDFSEAKLQSKSQKKMILLYFSPESSARGNEIAENMFGNATFQELSKKFILMRVDQNSDDQQTAMYNKRLVIHYNKQSYFPSLLAVDHNGAEKGKLHSDFTSKGSTKYLDFLKSL